MKNIIVHESGVIKLLKGLGPFKATGPDDIPAFILRQAAVSIAPYLSCKLLEHISHSSVMDHFDQHQVLCDEQHRSRVRRSSETQLTNTLDRIARNIDQGCQTGIIFLDFPKVSQ
jgi:hypothetical protein